MFIASLFQRVSGLLVTGKVDEATLSKMRQPRCGVEDPFNQKSNKYRRFGGKEFPPVVYVVCVSSLELTHNALPKKDN